MRNHMPPDEIELAKRLVACEQFVPSLGMRLHWTVPEDPTGEPTDVIVVDVTEKRGIYVWDPELCCGFYLSSEEWTAQTYPDLHDWGTFGALLGKAVDVEDDPMSQFSVRRFGAGEWTFDWRDYTNSPDIKSVQEKTTWPHHPGPALARLLLGVWDRQECPDRNEPAPAGVTCPKCGSDKIVMCVRPRDLPEGQVVYSCAALVYGPTPKPDKRFPWSFRVPECGHEWIADVS
jgi:hypothetical protein